MSLITLSGQGTSIQGNVTEGDIYSYGLNAYSFSSKINLVAPLTKEQISTNNGGGGNWGGARRDQGIGNGTIVQVDNDGVVLHILYRGEDY